MPDIKTEIKTKVKTKKQRALADPEFMQHYVDTMPSLAKAAEAIGMTPSGLSSGVAGKNCSKTAEIAARGVLAARKAVAQPDHLVMMRVTDKKMDAVRVLMDSLDVKLNHIGRLNK